MERAPRDGLSGCAVRRSFGVHLLRTLLAGSAADANPLQVTFDFGN